MSNFWSCVCLFVCHILSVKVEYFYRVGWECTKISGMTKVFKSSGQASLERRLSTTGSFGCITWQRNSKYNFSAITISNWRLNRNWWHEVAGTRNGCGKQRYDMLTLRTLLFLVYSVLVTMSTYVGDPIGPNILFSLINTSSKKVAIWLSIWKYEEKHILMINPWFRLHPEHWRRLG